jgi:lipopolysaccharide transport system permease protein
MSVSEPHAVSSHERRTTNEERATTRTDGRDPSLVVRPSSLVVRTVTAADATPSLARTARELGRYRELLETIVARELKVRYKQASLGILWAVIQPLALMIMFSVFFGGLAKIPADGAPYPLFSYAGLLPWSFFAASLNAAIPSLANNAHLITKIYFPREIFPLASVLAAAVDFGIAGVLFGGMLLWYSVPVTAAMLWLPLLLAVQVLFTLGLALFFSALNVRYRDVRHGLPLLLQVWMYASPVVYPVSLIPERYQELYLVNPMATLLHTYRNVTLHGRAPDLGWLALAAVIAAVTFWIGYRYFKVTERFFADTI